MFKNKQQQRESSSSAWNGGNNQLPEKGQPSTLISAAISSTKPSSGSEFRNINYTTGNESDMTMSSSFPTADSHQLHRKKSPQQRNEDVRLTDKGHQIPKSISESPQNRRSIEKRYGSAFGMSKMAQTRNEWSPKLSQDLRALWKVKHQQEKHKISDFMWQTFFNMK